MKRPSFQFYPGDWLNDAALRACSLPARGLWIDCMSIMHQGNPYGYMKVNGKVIDKVTLTRMVGSTLEEVERLLGELDHFGVPSIDASGCYFSRRMVKDEKLREIRAEGGKMGGNPALMKAKNGSNQGLPKVGGKVNQKPTPSSSSSSSSIKTPLPPSGDEAKAGEGKTKGPLQLRAEALFRRQVTTPLTSAEERALKGSKAAIVATSESDWQALEAFYAAPQRETYARKSFATLLNNWNGEIERARGWMADQNRSPEERKKSY